MVHFTCGHYLPLYGGVRLDSHIFASSEVIHSLILLQGIEKKGIEDLSS